MKTRTTSSGLEMGSGRKSSASTMLKIAVFAPIPNASVSMARPVNPGARRNKRNAYRKSWIRPSIMVAPRSSLPDFRTDGTSFLAVRKTPVRKKAARWAASAKAFLTNLQQLHVLRLPALGTFDDVERHRLSFFQTAKAVGLNGRKVYEHVLSVFPTDESITFCIIEPFDSAVLHMLRIPYL